MRTIVAATAVYLGLTALTAWIFAWPFEKAAFLAPVIVVSAAAIVGLVLLWTRVAWESLREAKHPRRIVVLSVAALALLVGLSLLGLKLPRE